MSASTQGNPEWLLRLEQAQFQLRGENYSYWLVTKGREYGVPEAVIENELLRLGVTKVDTVPLNTEEQVKKEEAPQVEEAPRKRGRPRKTEV